MKLLLVPALVVCYCSGAIASRQFQSAGSLIAAPAALPPTGTLSFMANPQFTLGDGNFHILFELVDPSATSYFQVVAGPNARIYQQSSTGSTATAAIANSPSLGVGTWSHFVVTWSQGGQTILYLNGAAVASCATTAVETSHSPWDFGARADGSLNSTSKIALFGVWNRVLTGPEIASLSSRQAPSTIPAGLFAEYDLNGASLAAQAGSGGTLVATGTTVADDPPPPPSPTLSLSGPATGTNGVPLYVSVGETYLKNTTSVILYDGGAGGAWSSNRLTLTAANPFAATTYTPAAGGRVALSMMNDQGLPSPANLTLQVTTLEPAPTLNADVTAKSVRQGSDATYTITQTIPSGYSGETPALRLFNLPSGFSIAVNGADCGASNSTISYFNWRNCGAAAAGTYTLTVHTSSLPAGQYYFSVTETERQFSTGSALTLTLTVN